MPTYEDNWRLTNEIHPTLGLLNEETIDWEAPVPKPDDGKRYKWNEETVSWVEDAELKAEQEKQLIG